MHLVLTDGQVSTVPIAHCGCGEALFHSVGSALRLPACSCRKEYSPSAQHHQALPWQQVHYALMITGFEDISSVSL